MEDRRSIRVQEEGASRTIGQPVTQEPVMQGGPSTQHMSPPHLHLYVPSEVQFEAPKLLKDGFGGRR